MVLLYLLSRGRCFISLVIEVIVLWWRRLHLRNGREGVYTTGFLTGVALHHASDFDATPILKLVLFFSFVIVVAIETLEDGTWRLAAIFFFFATARKVVTDSDGWCAMVNGSFRVSEKLMYSTSASLS